MFVSLFYLISPVLLLSPAVESELIQVKADRVEVIQQERSARLRGNVSVSWGQFVLKADAVDVSYDKDGAPSRWKASQNVKLLWRDRVLSSKDLILVSEMDRLVVTGPLDVSSDQENLRASRVVYYPKSQRLIVENVSGLINLKGLVDSE